MQSYTGGSGQEIGQEKRKERRHTEGEERKENYFYLQMTQCCIQKILRHSLMVQ